jgi:putative hemolysin
MEIFMKMNVLLFSVFAMSILSSCSSDHESGARPAIVNPASEYCIKKGGKIEIIKDEAGEKGMCHLPDGTVVEEWELFRREHSQQ